jgi:hypothetical protein
MQYYLENIIQTTSKLCTHHCYRMILGNIMSTPKIFEDLDKLHFTLFKAISIWYVEKYDKYYYFLI